MVKPSEKGGIFLHGYEIKFQKTDVSSVYKIQITNLKVELEKIILLIQISSDKLSKGLSFLWK